MSSCQRSAWASHLPLFLGSVLARSKHHNSIVLQSLSLIVTPSLTLFSTSFFSPFLQSYYISVKKFCQAPTKEPGPYCVRIWDDIWATPGETTSISPVAPVSPVAIDWAHHSSGAAKLSLCWQTLAKTVGPNYPRYVYNEANFHGPQIGQLWKFSHSSRRERICSSCVRER